ncbi:MAG: YrdB family protein [Canibacter sp.]
MNQKRMSVLPVVQSLVHLAVIVTVTVWGFVNFERPFPAVLWGIGAFIAAVLIWALFLSPKPVLRTDRFGQALIELLFIAAGVAALYFVGVPWLIVVICGVIAMLMSYLVLVSKPRT